MERRKKIRFMSAGVTDGCTFYRCIEPARVLRERGHDAQCKPKGYPLAELMSADVVVFARTYELKGLKLIRLLRAVRKETGRGPTLVYEVDDDLFSVPEHLGDLHTLFGKPDVHEIMRECIRLCDRVTVTNGHLASRVVEEAEEWTHGASVHVVPNWVPERFVVDAPPKLGDRVTIGWAGSATHRKDWEQLYVPLRRLLRGRDDVRVHVMGDPWPALRLYTVNPDAVVATDWAADVEGYLRSLDFHIGLAPLADDLFNRSKSDVKLKEYAARGIVPIASPVGPYAASDVPAFEPPGDWGRLLTAFANTPIALTVKAREALDWARANTLEAHADQWEDALLKGTDQ